MTEIQSLHFTINSA